jgi:hypothetical protein
MPIFTATKSTSIKIVSTAQSVSVPKGTQIGGILTPMEGAIAYIKLAGAVSRLGLKAGDKVIIAYPDWNPGSNAVPPKDEVVGTTAKPTSLSLPTTIDLKIMPYYSQRDAIGHGEALRMCNSSSHAMLATYLLAIAQLPNPLLELSKKNGEGVDDSYLLDYVKKFGDSTDHNAQTEALKLLGIESYWANDLSIKDMESALSKGIPMPIGVLHHGTIAAPCGGGHIVIAVGQCQGGIICNDPYGEGFDYLKTNGKGVVYPINPTMNSRWLVGDPNGGWGRVVTKVGDFNLPKIR